MITITAYCLDWHLNHSSAFHDMLVDPLKRYANVRLQAWDGVSWCSETLEGIPLVFCQLPPPLELLAKPQVRLVWLPMWDHARGYSQAWWNALPRSLRVVAFSEPVAERAQKARLCTLRLRYFKDPDALKPARWDEGRTLMYWNRAGMIGPQFLENLCAALKIDKLIFMSQIDPRVPELAAYTLPARLGRITVEEVPGFLPRDAYCRLLDQANTFIAPRLNEGVGMTFLEAMARGCAVFAFDGSTMNEYITHGENGYLFQPCQASVVNRLRLKVKRSAWRFIPLRLFHFEYPVTESQNWGQIRQLDLEKLGRTARQQCLAGFAEWQTRIPEYARFVLEW